MRPTTELRHLRGACKPLRLEEAAFEAMCERWPTAERREGLRAVATASIGALRLAIDRFAEEEGRTPLVELVRAALADLRVELSHV
ncbi:hypothetical protein [Xanthobacter sp. ZOL 2024]